MCTTDGPVPVYVGRAAIRWLFCTRFGTSSRPAQHSTEKLAGGIKDVDAGNTNAILVVVQHNLLNMGWVF